MTRMAKAVDFVRKNGVRIGTEVLINFVLPYAIYSLAQPKLGDVNALIASSGPPILWSLIEFARNRRVDAVSMLALSGIALSLLAFVGGGSVKFLQLRERLVGVAIGLVFVGSAAIGKPLFYYLARASMARNENKEELNRFESLRDNAGFKRTMTVMTLVWGFGLLADAAVAIALVFVLPIKTYMIAHQVLGYATTGALMGWTFWYARRMRRRGEARAAEASSDLINQPTSS